MTTEYPTMGGESVETVTQPMRDRHVLEVAREAITATSHVDLVAVPPGEKAVAVPASTTSVTATTLQPLLISMLRGVAEAFVLAAIAVFTLLGAVPEADARAILIVAGSTFFAKLAAAYGFGVVDQRTSQKEG